MTTSMAVPVWELLAVGDGDAHHAGWEGNRSRDEEHARPAISDAELVARVAQGDVAAFEDIYRAHVRGLVLYVARIVGARDAAIDVVQTLFLKLWQTRTRWTVDGALDVYLFAAARNAARNVLRAEATRARHTETAMLESRQERDGDADHQYAADLARAITRSIEALPPKCRDVFLLSRAEGLSYPAIAHRLGISVKTVEMHVSRALKGLREALAPFHE